MPNPPLSYLGQVRPAFLAHLSDRLSYSLCKQVAPISAAAGILAPERTRSVMLFLARRPPATLAEISRLDDQPHQLLAARLTPLEALGLIERIEDPTDRRRRPYRLTALGRADAARIEKVSRIIAAAVEQMLEDMGVDLIAALDEAIDQLHRRPLAERCRAVETANA